MYGVGWWSSGEFVTRRTGFEFYPPDIRITAQFMNYCSRSTRPCHPSVVGENEEQLCTAAATGTFLGSQAPSRGICCVSWCQAKALEMGD